VVAGIFCVVFGYRRRPLFVILIFTKGFQVLIVDEVVSILVYFNWFLRIFHCIRLGICNYIKSSLISSLILSIWYTGYNLLLNVSNRVTLLRQLKPRDLITKPVLQVYCNGFPRSEEHRVYI